MKKSPDFLIWLSLICNTALVSDTAMKNGRIIEEPVIEISHAYLCNPVLMLNYTPIASNLNVGPLQSCNTTILLPYHTIPQNASFRQTQILLGLAISRW